MTSSTVDTGLVCPACKGGRVRVTMRMLADGTAQCWGECPACGERVRGGALRRPIMFDAEAKVAESCAGWGRGQ